MKAKEGFYIHAEPYSQLEKVFKENAEPYTPGVLSEIYYLREAHEYASHFIYEIYTKNKCIRGNYKI